MIRSLRSKKPPCYEINFGTVFKSLFWTTCFTNNSPLIRRLWITALSLNINKTRHFLQSILFWSFRLILNPTASENNGVFLELDLFAPLVGSNLLQNAILILWSWHPSMKASLCVNFTQRDQPLFEVTESSCCLVPRRAKHDTCCWDPQFF